VTIRLVLLCAGATAATREARFADPDDALDVASLTRVSALRLGAAATWRCVAAPERSARESVLALGLTATDVPALADQSVGAWRGRDLATLPPIELAEWIAAPERGAPTLWSRARRHLARLARGRRSRTVARGDACRGDPRRSGARVGAAAGGDAGDRHRAAHHRFAVVQRSLASARTASRRSK
jgi:hypothetical protein